MTTISLSGLSSVIKYGPSQKIWRKKNFFQEKRKESSMVPSCNFLAFRLHLCFLRPETDGSNSRFLLILLSMFPSTFPSACSWYNTARSWGSAVFLLSRVSAVSVPVTSANTESGAIKDVSNLMSQSTNTAGKGEQSRVKHRLGEADMPITAAPTRPLPSRFFNCL